MLVSGSKDANWYSLMKAVEASLGANSFICSSSTEEL